LNQWLLHDITITSPTEVNLTYKTFRYKENQSTKEGNVFNGRGSKLVGNYELYNNS